MARVYTERRSFRNALKTVLEGQGWVGVNAITYQEGFRSEAPVVPPLVSITFVRPSSKSFQLGGGPERLYKRLIQVDCYMESEDRVNLIVDTVLDFMDLVPVSIVNENSTAVGSLVCQDTDSIVSEIFPPVMQNPRAIRWRGVIRGMFEAHYPDG